ncbi:hypothetical protein Bhyg_02558 [Pseudolycoriella hygida]|uniref:C2HC/C3H-type domain-containing protein n=1 Tax=Pseudolycoriella hygida TaxID=35572 RepID=A0A9Q0NBM5_9DIPT|nr:hypothetical protein Bhyg_02558 [Pseudolycoriella hygida]
MNTKPMHEAGMKNGSEIMTERKLPIPKSTTPYNNKLNDQGTSTQMGNRVNDGDSKNVAIASDGSIFVKTLVQMDPDSDLFMKVAQKAYSDHERSLVQCAKCNRKFFPDRIEKHQANCAAEKLPSTNSKKEFNRKK